MSKQEDAKRKEETKNLIENIDPAKADKILEDGPEWLCTVHLKLRIPCDESCGFLDNWKKDHEKCPKRVNKSDIVFGRIFGGKEGWVKKS